MTGDSHNPTHHKPADSPTLTHTPDDLPEDYIRIFHLRLDPTDAQRAAFEEELRAAKWAYNSYIKHWKACRKNWFHRRTQFLDSGLDMEEATKRTREEADTNPALKALSWTAFDTHAVTAVRHRHEEAERLQRALDNPLAPAHYEQVLADYDSVWTNTTEGKHPWAHRVRRRSLTSGLKHANAAVQNYLRNFNASYTGPRFKLPRPKKRLSDQSIIMDAETIGAYGSYDFRKNNRITNYHRVRLGSFRSVRTFNSTKPLTRALQRGGKAKSFTLRTVGGRWYTSIHVRFETPQTQPTTRKQRNNHDIGLDFGSRKWLTRSDDTYIHLPEYLRKEEKNLVRLQRRISRAQPGSKRHKKLCAAFAKKKHAHALQRQSFIHQVTKELATTFAFIGIEDLNVKGMTASARGTVDNPGTHVRAKSTLNRNILAGSPRELRRQLEYKTHRYGSTVIPVGRFYASSKLCSRCGNKKDDLGREEIYRCSSCELVIDRDVNAALNIQKEMRRLLSTTD